MNTTLKNQSYAPKRYSKIFQIFNTVLTVAARDITLLFKSPMTLIASLAMPIFMMGVLGGMLSQNMAGGIEGYGSFMLVGMLVNMLFMMTCMNMTSLVDDHESDFTQEMLISPAPRAMIVLGKIFGSMVGALISGICTVIVGLVMGYTVSIGSLLLILAISPLMCLAGGAFSMLLIGAIHNRKVANLLVNLIVTLQMFLAGAIIPIGNSKGILLWLSRIMPMTYCLDLARSIVGQNDAPIFSHPTINLIAIAAITLAGLIIGTLLFTRAEKRK